MTKAEKIELQLWRSGLVRKTRINRNLFADACKVVSRHVTRLDRIRIEQCNGIPKEWDGRQWIHGLDDDDAARHEYQTKESRAAIVAALKPFLTPGLNWRWYTDPRGAAVLRVFNRQNTRDAFL